MTREYIQDGSLPSRPHKSSAVRIGNLLFCSGQTASGPIETATEEALNKLKAVLQAGGSDLDKIIKANVFWGDMQDYAAMNKKYIEFFSAPLPARTCVSPAQLPNNAVFEIECVAKVG